MKTKQDTLIENRLKVIITFILIILYIIAIIKVGCDMIWTDMGDGIVFLIGSAFMALPFIAIFMGIWKERKS